MVAGERDKKQNWEMGNRNWKMGKQNSKMITLIQN